MTVKMLGEKTVRECSAQELITALIAKLRARNGMEFVTYRQTLLLIELVAGQKRSVCNQ